MQPIDGAVLPQHLVGAIHHLSSQQLPIGSVDPLGDLHTIFFDRNRSSTSSASSTGGSVSTDGELASAGGGGGGGGGRRGSTGARPANGDRTSSTKRIHRSRIEHASVGDAPPQGAGGLAMSLPSTFLPGLLKPYLASRGSEGTGLQAIGTTASIGSHSNPLPQILGKGSTPNTGKVHPM